MVRFPDKCEWQNRFNPERGGGLLWYTDGTKTNKDPGDGDLVGVWKHEEHPLSIHGKGKFKCFIKRPSAKKVGELLKLSRNQLRIMTGLFLILNFHHVLNVVCFLLGNSLLSGFYTPKFQNTLSVPSSDRVL